MRKLQGKIIDTFSGSIALLLLSIFVCYSLNIHADSYNFSGTTLTPNNSNPPFPAIPLTLPLLDNFVQVQSGTMAANSGNATITTQGNGGGYQNGVSVSAGAIVSCNGSVGANTINLVTNGGTNSDKPVSVTNNGIIQTGTNVSGNAVFMQYSNNGGTNLVNLYNAGLIQGKVSISSNIKQNYTFAQADPNVNSGITEVTGSFTDTNGTLRGSTMNIGQFGAAVVRLNSVSGVPKFNLFNSSTLIFTGAVTGVNLSFTIPSGCHTVFEPSSSFTSSSTFTVSAGGNLNIANTFVLATAAAGGFTNSGNLYVYGGGGITGNLSGGQSLTIGQDSFGNTYGTVYGTGGTITNMPVINLVNGTFIVFNNISGISNTFAIYPGATSVIAASVTGTGTFNINSGTARLEAAASLGMTGALNNTGNLIIGNTFNPATYSPFNNSGGQLFLVNAGSISSNITSGLSLSVGTNTDFTSEPCTFNNTSALISLPAINIHTGSAINNSGSGSISGSVYVLGTGTFSGNVSGPALTIGRDSFNNVDNATSFLAGSAISGFGTIAVSNGTFNNNGFAFTNVNSAFTIASGATATITGSFTGTAAGGASINSGTLNLQSTFGLSSFTNNNAMFFQTGAVNNTPITNANGANLTVSNNCTNNATITNNGTVTLSATLSGSGNIVNNNTLVLNVPYNSILINTATVTTNVALSPTNGSSNSGTINVNPGGSFTPPGTFTNTGTTNLNTGTAPLGAALTGSTGAALNIGNTGAITFNTAFTITNVPTIRVQNGSTFNAGHAITGVDSTFLVNSSCAATLTNTFSGGASSTGSNFGSLTVQNAFGLASFNNKSGGTLVFSGGSTNNTTAITNEAGGTFNITGNSLNSATLTNAGNMTLSATLNSGTIVNSSGGVLTFNGANNFDAVTNNSGATFNISGISTNSAAVSNSGTMNITAQLLGSATITNASGGTVTLGTNASVANNITNQSGATLSVTGANAAISSTLTNSGAMSASGGGTLTNTGTIVFASGSTSSVPIVNNNILSITAANPTNTATITNNATISGVSGTLTTNSPGSIVFATNSTNSATLVNNASLSVTGANAVNTGTITMNAAVSGAGTLTNNSGAVINLGTGSSNATTLVNSSGATINVTAASRPNTGTITNSGALAGAGSLLNNSSGVITFATGSSNSTTITNNATLSISGTATNSGAITNNATMSGAGTLTNNSSASITFGAGSAHSSTILNSSGATITVTGANATNTGTITNLGTIANGGGVLTNNGVGVIDFASNSANSSSITNNATLTISAATASNTGTIINNLTMNGAGTLTNNTDGIIRFAQNSANSAGITNNATLDVTGTNATNTGTISNAASITGTGTLTNNGAGNISFATGSSNAITLVNNATISLAGNATNTGTITNNATISGPATLTNSSGGLITFANGTANSASIANSSGATLAISGTSTNSAAISNSGTINLSAAITGAGSFTNNSGGTINFTTGATLGNDITNANGANLVVSNNSTNNAVITNNGTVTLSATLNGSGTLTNNNTLVLNVPYTAVLNNSATVTTGAALTPANGSVNSGTINITTGGTFIAPATFNYTGAINLNTGPTPLGGVLTGNTGSILRIGNSGTPAVTTNFAITNVEAISLENFGSSLVANAAITGVATAFTVNNGTTATLANTLSGAGTGTNFGSMTVQGALGLASLTNKSGATLTFSGGSTNNSTPITNDSGGVFNITGNSLNSATLTNSGTMSVSAALSSGTIVNLSGGLLTFNGASNADDVTNSAGATFNITGNSSNSATINNSGTMTIGATLSGAGTINNLSGGTVELITNGVLDNDMTNYNGANFLVTNPATNNGMITNNGIVTLSAVLSGTGNIINNNTLILNVPYAAELDNAATVTTTEALTPLDGSTNTGTINVNGGGSFTAPAVFTNTGTINLNTGPTALGGALTGNAGSILNIGNSNSATVTAGFAITNVQNINVVTAGSFFTTNQPVTGVASTFNVAAGTTATLANTFSGLGAGTNFGTLNIQGAFGLASLVNKSGATLTFSGGSTNNTTPITNQAGGIFNITGNTLNTATLTNQGTMTVSAGLNSGTIINQSGSVLTFNGANNADDVINESGATFNVSGNSTNTATVSNSGTMSITAQLNGAGTINNLTGGSLTLGTNASVANAINLQSGSTCTITGTNAANSGVLTSNVAISGSGTLTNTGTINLGTGASVNPNITNNATINFTANITVAGTLNNAGTLAGAGTLFSIGPLIFATNSANSTSIQNGGTITVTGANATNTGTITISGAITGSGTLTNNLGGSLIFAGRGPSNSTNLVNNATFSIPTVTLTNTGTISTFAALTGGGAINNTVGSITFGTGSSNALRITNSATGTMTINGASVSNTGTINNSGTIAGAGTLANQAAGVIAILNGSNVSATINNAGSMSTTGTVALGNVVNSGTFTYGANSTINAAGRTFTNSGTVTVSGQNALTATSYTSTGTHITSITDQSTADKLTVTGNVSLGGGGTLQVNSSFTSTSDVSWTVISATGTLIGPTNTSFPSSAWSANVVGNNLVVTYSISTPPSNFVTASTGAVNRSIAEVLNAMQNNITNAGQQSLIDAMTASLATPEYNSDLHELMPSINAGSTALVAQNALFTQTMNRMSGAKQGGVATQMQGISTGDINYDTSVWMNGLGQYVSQHAHGENDGYTAKIAGAIIGVDKLFGEEKLLGCALGVTNANVTEASNPGFTTRVLTYYGLLYGSDTFNRLFYEWTVAGGTNKYTGNRFISIVGNNYSITSSYRGSQASGKLNLGVYHDVMNMVRVSYLTSLQYSWLHQPPYNESGSVAALNVANNLNTNIFTLGAGIRLASSSMSTWQTGVRELHANVTYDVINPEQVTTANFLVGSNNFTVTNVPERLGLQLGAAYALNFKDRWQLQASYDLEFRSGFLDQIAQLKLKFLF